MGYLHRESKAACGLSMRDYHVIVIISAEHVYKRLHMLLTDDTLACLSLVIKNAQAVDVICFFVYRHHLECLASHFVPNNAS